MIKEREAMKLHLANLSPKATEQGLGEVFSQYGAIFNIEITWVRSLGRTVGSAIIEMHINEGLKAARALNGQAFCSRRLYITLMGEGMASNSSAIPAKARIKR